MYPFFKKYLLSTIPCQVLDPLGYMLSKDTVPVLKRLMTYCGQQERPWSSSEHWGGYCDELGQGRRAAQRSSRREELQAQSGAWNGHKSVNCAFYID